MVTTVTVTILGRRIEQGPLLTARRARAPKTRPRFRRGSRPVRNFFRILNEVDRKDAGLYVFGSVEEGIQMKRTDGAKTPPHTGPVNTVTVGELSAYLHVHRATIYRMMKRHEIPAFHVGGYWRFNIDEIDLWRLQQETFIARRNPRQ
jgi:excisionase family DNA binding protein